MLVDEMDMLLTRSMDVVYDFFNWPTLDRSSIVVIGVSNTTSLLDKLQSK